MFGRKNPIDHFLCPSGDGNSALTTALNLGAGNQFCLGCPDLDSVSQMCEESGCFVQNFRLKLEMQRHPVRQPLRDQRTLVFS